MSPSDLESTSSHLPRNGRSITRNDLSDGTRNHGESSESSPMLIPSPRAEASDHDTHMMLSGSYRRPLVATGGRPALMGSSPITSSALTRPELEDMTHDEGQLLADNHIIDPSMIPRHHHRVPSEHPERKPLLPGRDGSRSIGGSSLLDGETASVDSEDGFAAETAVRWEEAVMAGKIKTTWQRESTVLARYSVPLMITFCLQYSLTTASVLSAGNLGKNELAAVSLASMSSNITGFAIYQGLATSLDTLCAQAYGSGNKKMVGLHMQRMIYFLLLVTIPISIMWYFAEDILNLIIPQQELARLAGIYMRILILGAPGYAIFESGKRFTQAQGLFKASTFVLLIAAPTNMALNYLLVWHPTIGFGFAGAPTAVVITSWLMPLLLFLYVVCIDGSQCWGGFSRKAFTNWVPMIKLAIPGLLMIEAEFLAFELLTLFASYLSTAHLAAQSVVATITSFTYQVPFALSIACSTRVANFLGATLGNAAKTSAHTGLIAAAIFGIINSTLLITLRNVLPRIFTTDPEVIALVSAVLPLTATFQFVDCLAAMGAGILRGQGRQYIGGWVNLVAYYAVAIPFSVVSAFVWKWELFGLWSGVSIALWIVASVEGYVIMRTDWDGVVRAAMVRNRDGA